MEKSPPTSRPSAPGGYSASYGQRPALELGGDRGRELAQDVDVVLVHVYGSSS
jgi:hypothetical protein